MEQIITSAVGFAGVVLSFFIARAFDALASRFKGDAQNTAIHFARRAVLDAVAVTEQTFVQDIKLPGGKLDLVEAKQAAIRAIDTARLLLGAEGLKALHKATGQDADVWIANTIEAAVQQMKGAKK